MVSAFSDKVLLEQGLPLEDQPSNSASASASANSREPLDPVAERKLIWKVDRHLVPILFMLL